MTDTAPDDPDPTVRADGDDPDPTVRAGGDDLDGAAGPGAVAVPDAAATADGRDRRDDGRPEQARPRDRTGRPLSYGTTGVELAEEHEPTTVEEALDLGRQLWGQARFFEAHECLEHVWHAAPEDDQDLWQGVIQVAVAGVHLQRGNATGAAALLDRAGTRLTRYPATHRGIDVAAARAFCAAAAADLRDDPDTEVVVPPFPGAPDGPWFTADPSALHPPEQPTPIPDGPTWLAAGRPRAPRQREDGAS